MRSGRRGKAIGKVEGEGRKGVESKGKRVRSRRRKEMMGGRGRNGMRPVRWQEILK